MVIDAFQASHPEWDLRLDTKIRTVDYFAESIDICVFYGKREWEGLEKLLLMTEVVFPICAPDFLLGRVGKNRIIFII